MMPPDWSKTLWLIFNPANFLTALMVIGAVLLFTSRRRIGRFLIALVAGLALVIAYAPLEYWLLAPLQNRFASPNPMPSRIAGIIVLGGAVDARETHRRGQLSLNSRAERITAFAELAQRYPGAKLVYSGGGEPKSEAELIRPLLLTFGISQERLALETKSRDTYENALFTRRLVQPRAGESWILITSAAHMPRAVGTFRKIGWEVVPYPVDYSRLGEGDDTFGRNLSRGLNMVNAALREWVSLAHYYVSGRTANFFPSPKSGAQ